MKKISFWIIPAILLSCSGIFAGCEPDIPVNYPRIELPPTGGQSTSIVVDDIIDVPASKLWHKTIEIPPALTDVRLIGWCTASGGARNDIKVLVLNDIDFHNWRNFSEVEGLYQSEKTTVASIDVPIETHGKYHLVISNWFSEFSSKKVIAKVYMYWSVKPFTFTIGADDLQAEVDTVDVPASANVTIVFEDETCAGNLRVNADTPEARAVSVNVTAPEAQFIAPPSGKYVVRCGNGGGTVKGRFTIVPSEPSIGDGLIVASSTTNEAPRLGAIGDKSAVAGQAITFMITAVDPDDNPVSYYACNLPPGATFDSATGRFTWTPPQGSAGTRYFVHFEASDGVLNDSENIAIDVQ